MTEQEIKALIEQDSKVLHDVRQEIESAKQSNKSLSEQLEVQATAIKANAETLADLKDAIKVKNRENIASSIESNKEMYGELVAFARKGEHRDGNNKFTSKSITSTNDPLGGYFIMPEIERGIMDLVRNQGAIASLASISTIGTSEWKKFVRTAGMAARRIAQGATGGESTTPTYGEIKIQVHDAECEPHIHNSALEDMEFDILAELVAEASEAFSQLMSDEIVNGNGVGEGRGILGYDTVANASYTWGNIGFITSGASGAFTGTKPENKLVNLQHSLKRQYRPNARFVMNDATLAVVRVLEDGVANKWLWQADPAAGFGGVILGSRVEIDDYMPDIAANSFSIAYGDFKAGTQIVRRRGVSLIRDNITAKGQTKFNFTTRFGCGVKNFEAIKLMKFSA